MPLISPAARGPRFHPLRVAAVTPITPAASAIDLAVAPELSGAFAYTAGQYVTLRVRVGGNDARRSYSLCTTPEQAAHDRVLRIGVARVEGGLVSPWLTSDVRAGDVVRVATPRGSFTLADPGDRHTDTHHVALVAGAGITPVLPMLTVALGRGDRATLVFGNRDHDHVMFVDELADLAARYPDRLRVVHVFSRGAAAIDLPAGRLDAVRLAELLDSHVAWEARDHWYLCGPDAFVAGARQALRVEGIDDASVHAEAFHTDGAQQA